MFKHHLYAGKSFGHPHRVRNWLRMHKKIAVPSAVVLVLLLGGGSVFVWQKLHHKPMPALAIKKGTSKPKTEPPAPKYFSPLTGAEVTKEQSEKPVTAIMIENSPDARPQSGMIDAGVVFEAIAEGGITRFLTLFQEKGPLLVGPVRSLRMYYVDWLAAFDASVVHVGGSSKALSTVRGGGFKDLDQFFNGPYFWRATDRYAPHNVYTSFEKLNELNAKKGYAHSNFTGFARKADNAANAPAATKIQVNISGPLYNSSYVYNKNNNNYLRSEGGAAHIDRESKKQLNPKVVIVIKAKEVTVLEDGYRQSIETVGSGEAWVFQDGGVTVGSWQKPSQREQIVFKDSAGQPLKINAGMTWITSIPVSQSVTWQP